MMLLHQLYRFYYHEGHCFFGAWCGISIWTYLDLVPSLCSTGSRSFGRGVMSARARSRCACRRWCDGSVGRRGEGGGGVGNFAKCHTNLKTRNPAKNHKTRLPPMMMSESENRNEKKPHGKPRMQTCTTPVLVTATGRHGAGQCLCRT